MRTIKFRGKRVDDGGWVYGDFCNYKFDGMDETIPCIHIGNLGYIKNAFYQVDPNTVGQFTDILDKNGKEIWEGDIVHFVNPGLGYDLISPVIFEHGDFCMMKNKNYLIPMGNFSDVVFEVIGNLHDNPEMLKGGEKK